MRKNIPDSRFERLLRKTRQHEVLVTEWEELVQEVLAVAEEMRQHDCASEYAQIGAWAQRLEKVVG